MHHYVEPSLEISRNLLEQALKHNELITIYCDCEVNYEGRAYSKLEQGDRLVIIKPDKNLLVHKPKGRNPVNWMSAGSSIKFDFNNNSLFIIAESINPREHMIIKSSKVMMFQSCALNDEGEVSTMGSEADMARMIYEKPYLISNEFKPVSLEEQTKYGYVDVMGHDDKGTLIIIECKRITAGLSAVQQLRRYVEKIKKAKGVKKVIGYIAAPSMTKNSEQMLKDWGYRFAQVEPPMQNTIDKAKQKRLKEFIG